jgi:hypothetical protein
VRVCWSARRRSRRIRPLRCFARGATFKDAAEIDG